MSRYTSYLTSSFSWHRFSISPFLSLLLTNIQIFHRVLKMLALVILFTIFVGLIGLLAVAGEYQKRRRSSADKKKEKVTSRALDKVECWLLGHGLEIPSTRQVTSLLNSSLQQTISKVISCSVSVIA